MAVTLVESLSRGVLYRSIMRVDPAGEGCTVSWEFGSEAKTTSAKLMSVVGKLFEGQTRKALMQDLDDIAKAAEREG